MQVRINQTRHHTLQPLRPLNQRRAQIVTGKTHMLAEEIAAMHDLAAIWVNNRVVRHRIEFDLDGGVVMI